MLGMCRLRRTRAFCRRRCACSRWISTTTHPSRFALPLPASHVSGLVCVVSLFVFVRAFVALTVHAPLRLFSAVGRSSVSSTPISQPIARVERRVLRLTLLGILHSASSSSPSWRICFLPSFLCASLRTKQPRCRRGSGARRSGSFRTSSIRTHTPGRPPSADLLFFGTPGPRLSS